MNMPERLTRVGELESVDHFHLPKEAICYFWGEYTSYEHTQGLKWNYSETNRLISNLKKKIGVATAAELQYKAVAVDRVAKAFSLFWRWSEFHEKHRVVLIPMPPSKPKSDPQAV